MYKFGIYTNFDKDTAFEKTQKVIDAIEESGYEVCLEEDLQKHVGGAFHQGFVDADYLFVLGGDGTILSAARKYAHLGLSIIGLNLGRMGFLAEINPGEVKWAIQKILDGQYRIETRMMLEARSDSFEETLLALNEFVVSPRNLPRMVSLELKINGSFAEKYYCDGMIVASPTGSTGYTISAGGPIIAPNVNCMLVTPVCAHTLNARSIILNENDMVEVVSLSKDVPLFVTADGQYSKQLSDASKVIVKKSDICARFVRLKHRNFYELLKVKLAQWKTEDHE
jgi:NAD+ kinase